MTYVLASVFVIGLIYELIDIWQASKKTLHYQCYQKLYPNGYLDAAVGNARVDRAQPIQVDGLENPSDARNHLPVGTYRVGLRWDNKAQDYQATAQITTWVLGRGYKEESLIKKLCIMCRVFV
ncbi:MAG: hypothetical protein U0518_02485 [Candidatus Gracilibacteria bacterium]